MYVEKIPSFGRGLIVESDPKLEQDATELIWKIHDGTEELTEDNVVQLANTVGGLSFLEEYAAEMGIDLLATHPNCCSKETLVGWLRDKNSGYPQLLSLLASYLKGSDISIRVKNPGFFGPMEISHPIPLISINSTLTMKGRNPIRPEEVIGGENLERAVAYTRSIILSNSLACFGDPETPECSTVVPVDPEDAVCIAEPAFVRNDVRPRDFVCGVVLSDIDNVVKSGNAYEQRVDCNGMRNLMLLAQQATTGSLGAAKFEMQETIDGETRSIKFFLGGTEVAHAEEIPDTGHYDYAVYNNDGKYIGFVTLMVGIHFFDVSSIEVAWERPEGFAPIPGVLEIKIQKRQTEIRNNPQQQRVLEMFGELHN